MEMLTKLWPTHPCIVGYYGVAGLKDGAVIPTIKAPGIILPYYSNGSLAKHILLQAVKLRAEQEAGSQKEFCWSPVGHDTVENASWVRLLSYARDIASGI